MTTTTWPRRSRRSTCSPANDVSGNVGAIAPTPTGPCCERTRPNSQDGQQRERRGPRRRATTHRRRVGSCGILTGGIFRHASVLTHRRYERRRISSSTRATYGSSAASRSVGRGTGDVVRQPRSARPSTAAPAAMANAGSRYASRLKPLAGGAARTRTPYWSTKYLFDLRLCPALR